jgi:hypothetical protein
MKIPFCDWEGGKPLQGRWNITAFLYESHDIPLELSFSHCHLNSAPIM